MRVRLLKGDITKQDAEAIVVTANGYLAGAGENYNTVVHAAAGPELAEACKQVGICRPGEAKLTPGYKLPSDFVIHAVGPTWRGGVVGEKNILSSCYVHSIALAFQYKLESIAFSLLSVGPHGVPKKEAVTVALSTLLQFEDEDIDISLVLGNSDTFMMANRILAQLTHNNKPTDDDEDDAEVDTDDVDEDDED